MSSQAIPKLTLTYFPIGGRAEPIRLAFAAGNIPFTNKVLTFPEFNEAKPTFPLGQVPILDMDFGETKKTLTQSTSILRYVGKLGGLYPTDDHVTAMEIDEITSILEDMRAPIATTVQGSVKSLLSDETEFTAEEKLAIRKRWVEKSLPHYLGFIEKKLAASSSGWLVGDSLSIADLMLFCELTWFSSGVLDGIPVTVLEPYSGCTALMEKVKGHDGVKKWMDSYSKPYQTFDYLP